VVAPSRKALYRLTLQQIDDAFVSAKQSAVTWYNLFRRRQH
jgi:hypothetical protein